MGKLTNALKHGWNVFVKEETDDYRIKTFDYGASYGHRPDRPRMNISNERSIIASIYTRMAIDAAAVDMAHVKVDTANDNRYLEDVLSGLNTCLTVEANIDQAARAFKQNIAMSVLDKGVAAIVPVDTTGDPILSGSYIINSLRVGEVVEWYPQHVRVSLYDDRDGQRKEVTVPKRTTAIVENPLYAVMNEPNSTLQRLIRKLNLLDAVDEASSSGKLDLIIQLPYVIKSEARKAQAEQRRSDIELQLKGSKYGIAYTDGTEKVTQLNRPAENNLLGQIEYLNELLYGQLGITKEVLLGTADAATMTNYYNRTTEPLLAAITEAMTRTFLTKTARTQGHVVKFYRDPFKLMSISDLAELGDKLTRNEIASSNEMRSFIGMKPSKDSKADELRNKNLPNIEAAAPQPVLQIQEGELQNES